MRRRDAERFITDVSQGTRAGSQLLLGNQPKPTPLTKPQREAVALSAETAAVTAPHER